MKFLAVLVLIVLVFDDRVKCDDDNNSKGDDNKSGGGHGGSGESDLSEETKSKELLDYYVFKLVGLTHNKKSNTVIMYDYEYKATYYLDGVNGHIFIYCSITNRGIHITKDASNRVWIASKQSFEEYSKKLPTYKELVEIGIKSGTFFDENYIAADQEKALSAILSSQSLDYNQECKTLIYVIKITRKVQYGRIGGFEKVFGDSKTAIRYDANALIGITGGLKRFTSFIDGEFEGLAKKNFHGDWGKYINIKSGELRLVYWLTIWSKYQYDIGKIYGKVFDHPAKFYGVLVHLSGGMRYGYNGFTWVAYHTILYSYQFISVNEYTSVLRQYITSKRGHKDDKLEVNFISYTKQLLVIFENLKLNDKFKVTHGCLKGIVNKKWIVNEINVYAVFKLIIEVNIPNDNPDGDIKKILDEFKKKVKDSGENKSKENKSGENKSKR